MAYKSRVNDFIQELRGRARAAMEEIRRDAVADLQKTTGIQGPPRSLPGEPPHMDTQDLNRSITSASIEQGSTFTAIIADDTPYVLALEFGYAENNLQPRPHMAPVMKRTKERAPETLKKHLGAPM